MVMLALTCIWAAWVAWLAGSYLWQVGKTASDNREVAEIMLGMLPMILACPTALYALFMVPLFVLHFCIRPPTE
jgi:ABC-type antimicrobial peptide transport system permease subunit